METSDKYDERITLASELAQVLDKVRELEAHMDQSSAAARELCRALASSIRASVDKSVSIAMSCCPGSPPSAEASPRSDPAGNARKDASCKKRKGLPKWKRQVRVSSVQDIGPLDDGFSWRKYGQKDIVGDKYPRAYFRCTHRHTQGCWATKQVQRADGDPLLFDVLYQGAHTCTQTAAQPDKTPMPSPTAIAEAGHSRHGQEQSFLAARTQGVLGVGTTPVGVDGNAIYSCLASPFVSLASSECRLGLGARHAPDAELASTTNSAMDDVDFMFHFDDDFLNWVFLTR